MSHFSWHYANERTRLSGFLSRAQEMKPVWGHMFPWDTLWCQKWVLEEAGLCSFLIHEWAPPLGHGRRVAPHPHSLEGISLDSHQAPLPLELPSPAFTFKFSRLDVLSQPVPPTWDRNHSQKAAYTWGPEKYWTTAVSLLDFICKIYLFCLTGGLHSAWRYPGLLSPPWGVKLVLISLMSDQLQKLAMAQFLPKEQNSTSPEG